MYNFKSKLHTRFFIQYGFFPRCAEVVSFKKGRQTIFYMSCTVDQDVFFRIRMMNTEVQAIREAVLREISANV